MTDTYEIKGDRLILQNEFGTLRLTAEQCDAIGKFARKHALDQLTAQAEEQGEYDEAPSPDYAVKDYNLLERMHKQEGASRDQADHFDAGWEACYTYYHINHLQHNQLTWKKYYDGAMKRANENARLYQDTLQELQAKQQALDEMAGILADRAAELTSAKEEIKNLDTNVASRLREAEKLLRDCKAAFDVMKIHMMAKPIHDYFDTYQEPQ
jgi:hypothetical protein